MPDHTTISKDFNLSVGLRIREIREALSLSREKFSEQCDISESFLASVENGNKSITSKTLYKICSSFQVSADYIIMGYTKDFEIDAILEMLNSLDYAQKSSALKILAEYTKTVRSLSALKKTDTKL